MQMHHLVSAFVAHTHTSASVDDEKLDCVSCTHLLKYMIQWEHLILVLAQLTIAVSLVDMKANSRLYPTSKEWADILFWYGSCLHWHWRRGFCQHSFL